MVRNILRSKSFWALVLPVAFIGSAYAGQGCLHSSKTADKAAAVKDVQAAKAADYGSHCSAWKKGITKTAKMTDDGAVVTLKGTNDKAISHIQSHLTAHSNEQACPTCPLSTDGVNVEVKMMKKGGKIYAVGSSADTIKAIQDWASKSNACCADSKAKQA